MANAMLPPLEHPATPPDIRSRLVEELHTLAEQHPVIRSAYLRPDGLEFLVYCSGLELAALEAVVHLATSIQMDFYPHDEDPIFEGHYIPIEDKPREGWIPLLQ